MGKPTGFQEYDRRTVPYRPAHERVSDYDEIYTLPQIDLLKTQGARCMDCGVPFCQSGTGCPVDNLIPEWNDLVYRGRWRDALDRLHRTNNFPEFTGRVCPAPCEGACVLGINDDPVTIKDIENSIVDRGWDEGWIVPQPPTAETGFSVGIVGSGPAGLAAAQQLRRMGHGVTVYERADRIGGLLVYGIPSMKLGKDVVARRVAQLADEGVEFRTGADVGGEGPDALSTDDLRARHDALLLCTGSTRPRDLPLPGRDLRGVHFAVPYLTGSTQATLEGRSPSVDARGKHVVVIGGGDTGTDCIATAIRQGCASVVNFELLDRPPAERHSANPWPEWPHVFRVDYGHAEARERWGDDPRVYTVMTTAFVSGEQGQVAAVETAHVDWSNGRPEAVAGTERVWPADLVLVSAGFVGPEAAVAERLEVETDARGTYLADEKSYATSTPGVFAAGDCRRGQSLVVWAIREGREAAASISRYLGAELRRAA